MKGKLEGKKNGRMVCVVLKKAASLILCLCYVSFISALLSTLLCVLSLSQQ